MIPSLPVIRLVRAVLMAIACATGIPGSAVAQAVTATSGDPAVIASIRAEFAATEREAPGYRRTQHELFEFSLEGGELQGFYRGDELRKLSARHYGETGQASEEYYYANGRLIFIHVVHQQYERPFGEGGVRMREEHRLYFDRGRLIRRVHTQHPPDTDEDLTGDDPDVADLLETARLFAACAAAPAGAERECTAPAR